MWDFALQQGFREGGGKKGTVCQKGSILAPERRTYMMWLHPPSIFVMPFLHWGHSSTLLRFKYLHVISFSVIAQKHNHVHNSKVNCVILDIWKTLKVKCMTPQMDAQTIVKYITPRPNALSCLAAQQAAAVCLKMHTPINAVPLEQSKVIPLVQYYVTPSVQYRLILLFAHR